MPNRILLSVTLAATGLAAAHSRSAQAAGLSHQHRHQLSLAAGEPVLDMRDVLDSAPALIYNDTVSTARATHLTLDASEKEFVKINRLLDKQISESNLRVTGTQVRLRQAVSCVEDSSGRLTDFKEREAQARAELARMRVEAGLVFPTTTIAASTTAVPPKTSISAVTTPLPQPAEVTKLAGAANGAASASLEAAFVDLQQSNLAADSAAKLNRDGNGQGLRGASSSSSSSSLSEADRILQEEGGTLDAHTAGMDSRSPVSIHLGGRGVWRPPRSEQRSGPADNNVGGYSRIENVRAFIASSTAAAAARSAMPPVSSSAQYFIRGSGGFGSPSAGGSGASAAAPNPAAGAVGAVGAVSAGGSSAGSSGIGASLANSGADPLKDVLAKATERLQNWLESVAAQVQATQNRRDECTVQVDELTSLLASQRSFLSLLKTRKEYERKLYRAQRANDQSLADFADQETEVLLADLIKFNRKWNAVHVATPELQLPPVSIPDWEDYSNTVALADEGPPNLVAAGASGGATAVAAVGGGSAVSLAVALGAGSSLPRATPGRGARKLPVDLDTTEAPAAVAVTTLSVASTSEIATTTPSLDTSASTPEIVEAQSTVGSTPAHAAVPGEETTTAEASTTPPLPGEPVEIVPEAVPTTAKPTTAAPIVVEDAPVVSGSGKVKANISDSGELRIDSAVKAWADINQTAVGNSEYSAFDISKDLFASE